MLARSSWLSALISLLATSALSAAADRDAPWPLPWTLVGARAAPPRSDGQRVVYRDVYPGIALTLESRRDDLTYRFDLAPGADPAAIRLHYTGAGDAVVEDGGRALRLRAGSRSLRESGLACFEGDAAGRAIACRYAVVARRAAAIEVAFEVAPFDRSRGLVIDPVIAWSSYLGGSDIEIAYGVAVDPNGSVYVTGETRSSDFPATGGFDTTLGGAADVFVAKVNAAGSSLAWASYLGGLNDEYRGGVAVDSSGNAYVTGGTNSPDFPSMGGFDTTLDGFDAFVTKVAADGSMLIWSSYLGGNSNDSAYDVAVNGIGQTFVVGYTISSDFPSAGGFDATIEGPHDAFVTKVSADGSSIIWSSFLGGNGGEEAHGVAVDGSGNVFLAGSTFSSNFPSMGAFDSTLNGIGDAFATKVDSSGTSLAWSTYLGGSADDLATALAIDVLGNVYLTGETYSTDFPTPMGFDTMLNGASDAFVAKITTIAMLPTLTWASYLGGTFDDWGYGVAVDPGGNVYVTGQTSSLDFPLGGGFDTAFGGGYEGFVTQVDTSGSSLGWSSYLGGASTDHPNDIAVDLSGRNVYVTGETFSWDFAANGGFDSTLDGSQDAFVTRISTCGDGLCDGALGEDTCTCSQDCFDFCGDLCCTGAEDPCTCPVDCGADTCPNGCCGTTEDCFTCADCACLPSEFCMPGAGTCEPRCGDMACVAGDNEDCITCPGDCACLLTEYCDTSGTPMCQPLCGDMACGAGEDCDTCSTDCGCAATEYCDTSPPPICQPLCGDMACVLGDNEDCNTCVTDCPCGGGEFCNTTNTPATCDAGCGDGSCTGAEDCDNCTVDCMCGASEYCNSGSFPATCDPLCGDGVCVPGDGEDCSACGTDCMCAASEYCDATAAPVCAPLCGNGLCAGSEDCTNCPADCPPCTEAGVEPGPEPAVEPGPEPTVEPAPDGPVAEAAMDAGGVRDDAAPDAEVEIDLEARDFFACSCEVGRRTRSPWMAWLVLILVGLPRLRRMRRHSRT